MKVSITILNETIDHSIPECSAALELKELLSQAMPAKATGNIYIGYGLTLCGQEVRDIDIAIFGELKDCYLPEFYTNNPQYPKKGLVVKDFCVVLELKEAPIGKVNFSHTHFFVTYKNGPKDVTAQSEKQRYAMSNYLAPLCGTDVYVANAIWFKDISENDFVKFKTGNPVGAFPSSFNFTSFIKTVINQGITPRYNSDNRCYELSSCFDCGYMVDIKKKLFEERRVCSEYTRRKLEAITQKNIDVYLSNIKLGDEKVILRGKAGTGKTFMLLQAALKLANAESGKRCLLLTYNQALVSDIRRLLHYLEIPDGIDSYTVQIQTMHSFFMQMMETIGIFIKGITASNRFNEREYNKCFNELFGYVKDLMDANDIKVLKDDNHIAIDWDYILIDEAQDWDPKEKTLLEKVYGEERLIIADGELMFIRSSKNLNWGGKPHNLSIGRRQKSILVKFINILAEEMGINWKQDGSNAINGGRVIIKPNYKPDYHRELEGYCKEQQCENYDMLFLVPPAMVEHDDQGSHFKNIKKWEQADIKIFDGTNPKLREQYSTDVNECRLYQYESCRGLEGWVVVCLQFDKLIKYKKEHFSEFETEASSLALESKEEKLKKYLWMWTMMAFTRAIDTLVITIKEPSSEIGKILKRVAEKHPDIVTWEID